MKFLNVLKTWLLVLIMVAMTSGAVNAKVASGGINLAAGVSQSIGVAKSLNALGIAEVSTMSALDSPLATNKGGDLFRVVDDVELADIKKTGAFRTASGSFEGKQFVDNAADAKALQKKFSNFFGGNQTIVKGQAPKSVLDNASKVPFADIPNGTAITVTKGLSKVKPKL